MITCHGLSDPGCVRDHNEDRILLDPELGFCAVADGMGGHQHGELAAELALATLHYYLESSRDRPDVTWPFGYNLDLSLEANRLATGIRLANRQVWKRAEERPEFAGMGSTIAALLVAGSDAAVANIGDSRVYLFRQGQIAQISIDDTWLSAVLQRGALDPAALANHPMRNVLTQATGSQHDVDVHTAELSLTPGDTLLLSSDGLHHVVDGEGICAILRLPLALEQKAGRLIEAARAGGAPDNVSCVLVEFTA